MEKAQKECLCKSMQSTVLRFFNLTSCFSCHIPYPTSFYLLIFFSANLRRFSHSYFELFRRALHSVEQRQGCTDIFTSHRRNENARYSFHQCSWPLLNTKKKKKKKEDSGRERTEKHKTVGQTRKLQIFSPLSRQWKETL